MLSGHQPSQASVNITDSEGQQPDTIRIIIRDAKPPLLARILQGAMRILCLLLFICVCGIGIPRLFGVQEFNVLTGSMTPDYPIGTLVFVQPKEPAALRPGEVVSVVMNEDLDVLTHRVVSNNYDDKTITTKGDANNSNDAPVLYENVIGVVCFSIPYVGAVVDYITNDPTGRIVGIGVLIAVLVLTFLAEGISSVLTKQSANVYGQDEPAGSGGGDGGGDGDDSLDEFDDNFADGAYDENIASASSFDDVGFDNSTNATQQLDGIDVIDSGNLSNNTQASNASNATSGSSNDSTEVISKFVSMLDSSKKQQ